MRQSKVPHTIEDLELIAHERLQAQPGCEDILGTRVSLDENGAWAISATSAATANLIAIEHGKINVECELRSRFPIANDL